ncbi:MAG: glycosyltransferase [Solirubrobacterales bacterium]
MRSGRILLATWGSLGDLNPVLRVARALQDRGHRVVLATLDLYADYAAALDLPFHPLPPSLAIEDAEGFVARLMDPKTGPRFLFSEVLSPAVRGQYAALGAAAATLGGVDAVVSHMITPAAALFAEKTGTPWASLMLQPQGYWQDTDPPEVDLLPWIRPILALHPAMTRGFLSLVKKTTAGWIGPIVALRDELGLSHRGHPMFEGQHSPYLPLGLFSPLLLRTRKGLPAKAELTGFPFATTAEPVLDDGIERFLAAGEPPILFTLGSSATWVAGPFWRMAVEAAGRLGRRALLVGRPNTMPAALPESCFTAEYASYARLMPRCAAIVHQGGMGTTAEALRSGRPMVVVPFAYDQPDNAARCQWLGVGRTVLRQRLSTDRLTAALGTVLADGAIARRCAEIGAQVAAETGAVRAAEAIEGLFR